MIICVICYVMNLCDGSVIVITASQHILLIIMMINVVSNTEFRNDYNDYTYNFSHV